MIDFFQWPTNRRGTMLAGAILSLMLHAGLIGAFRSPAAPDSAAAHHPGAPSLVWIVPQKSTLANRVGAREAVGLQPRIAATKRFPRVPPASVYEPPAAARPEAIRPAALPEAQVEPDAQPRFDVTAAMKSARQFAGERARKGDPAVAQLQDKPINELKTETSLGRAIAGAARPDCKNIASGTGLLALLIVPIVVLTDQKDSGCKW